MTTTHENWLQKADNDLDSVRRAMIADPDTNNESAAYHLQQAAEKLLKAALVHAGLAYPRGSAGHDLRVTAERLPPLHPLYPDAQMLAPFTPWATEFRYPSDDPMTASPPPTITEIEEAKMIILGFRDRLIVHFQKSPPSIP